MSLSAMNWAWKQALTPHAKLLLMALADRADDQGVCWPSIPKLAQQCRLSPRTVQRLLQALVAAALLRAEPRFRADGSRTSNRYYLALGAPVTPRTTTRTAIEYHHHRVSALLPTTVVVFNKTNGCSPSSYQRTSNRWPRSCCGLFQPCSPNSSWMN